MENKKERVKKKIMQPVTVHKQSNMWSKLRNWMYLIMNLI